MAVVVPVLYVLLGNGDTATELWASYVATAIGGTYGYLLAYLLVAGSALLHFGQARTLRPHVGAAAVLSIVGILFVGYNVFDQYDRSLPHGFSAPLLLGIAWFAVIWRTKRSQAKQVGTFSLTRESQLTTRSKRQMQQFCRDHDYFATDSVFGGERQVRLAISGQDPPLDNFQALPAGVERGTKRDHVGSSKSIVFRRP